MKVLKVNQEKPIKVDLVRTCDLPNVSSGTINLKKWDGVIIKDVAVAGEIKLDSGKYKVIMQPKEDENELQ